MYYWKSNNFKDSKYFTEAMDYNNKIVAECFVFL